MDNPRLVALLTQMNDEPKMDKKVDKMEDNNKKLLDEIVDSKKVMNAMTDDMENNNKKMMDAYPRNNIITT